MSSSSSSGPSIPVPESLPSVAELKEEAVAATKSSVQSLRALVAGGVGGVCAVIVGHPFDLVKVRLQTAEKGVYSGAIDVVRRTVAREGMVRVGDPAVLQKMLNRRKANTTRGCMQASLRRWLA